VTNYIKSVARLRAIIDRLVETCAVERLGVITDDCGFYFIDVGECFDDGGQWSEDGHLVDDNGEYWRQHGDVEDVELH
jgi:hypothetical protein